MGFWDDKNDPYSTQTVMGWVRAWQLGQQMQTELADLEEIKADLEEIKAADAELEVKFWQEMAADGVPVSTPETSPEPASTPEPTGEPEAAA